MRIINEKGFTQWKLKAQKEISYDVVESTDIFDPSNPTLLLGSEKNGKRLIFIDAGLKEKYENLILNYFERNQIAPTLIALDASESNKNLDQFFKVTQEIDKVKLDRRNEPIIAIGGGVLSDIVGFASSCFRRGLPYVKVPTTLMGYVDAGLAIKTSIDFDGHKNRIGAFYAPIACILDKSFLQALPTRHIKNGCGEILKLGVIKDRTLFEILEEEGVEALHDHFQNRGQEILRRSVFGMLEELENDFFEKHLAAILTFGHNFSPILEMKDLSGILHGEAVMIDVCFCSVLSWNRGFIDDKTLQRILNLTSSFEFALTHPALTPENMWQSLEERTLHHGGLQRIPLPTDIGSATFVNDLTKEELAQGIDDLIMLSKTTRSYV